MFTKLAELNDDAIATLGDSLGETIDAEIIGEEIKSGVSELWQVLDGDAYCVTRIEPGELVIVAFGGKGLLQVTDAILKAAKSQGLQSIRFHTNRPALARLVKKYKPRHIEHIYRIDCDG